MDYHCFLFCCWWFLCIKTRNALVKPPMKLVTIAIIETLQLYRHYYRKNKSGWLSIAYTSYWQNIGQILQACHYWYKKAKII